MGANNNFDAIEREVIFEAWGGVNALSGRKIKHYEIDHIIPENLGGKHIYSNACPLLRSVNNEKSGRDMATYLIEDIGMDTEVAKCRQQELLAKAASLAPIIKQTVAERRKGVNEHELYKLTDKDIELIARKNVSKKKPYNDFQTVFKLLRDYIKYGIYYITDICLEALGLTVSSIRAKLVSIKIETVKGLRSIYNPAYEGQP